MKSFYLLTSLILTISLLPNKATACSCGGPDSFCATLLAYEEHFDPDNYIAVIGEKVEQVEHGMKFKICQLMRGTETKTEIMIWGDVGHLCRHYTGGFEIGERVLLLLYQLDEDGDSGSSWASLEKKDDYVLSFCGVHVVSCETGINSYGVADELECFENNPCEISTDCPGGQLECDFAGVELFPNPTNGNAFISIFEEDSPMFANQVRVLNTIGQEVRKMPYGGTFPGEGKLEIDLEGLTPGLYLVEISLPFDCNNKIVRKVLVQ